MRFETSIGQLASAKIIHPQNSAYSGYLNTNHSPGTVTDLAAVTGSQEGAAQLNWTALGADGALGQASAVIIKVATAPITSQALFEAASTYALLTPLPAGGFESRVLQHLAPGPDYYFAVEARDAAKNQGALSNLASANTFAIPPADIMTLTVAAGASGGEAILNWASPGDDGNLGALNPGQIRIDYSTEATHSYSFDSYKLLIATIAIPGTPQSPIVSGLQGNALYSFGVFTGDDVPVFSGPSNVASVLTPAYAPQAAAYSGATESAFTAKWVSNNNKPGTQFYVEVSSDTGFSPALASSGWTSASSATFSGLEAASTYYAHVKARNDALVESAFTDLGPIYLSVGLAAPGGITASGLDRRVRLNWSPVLSGGPIGILLYRSTSPAGPFSVLSVQPILVTEYSDSGLANGVTYYYSMSSFNRRGESPLSGVVASMARDALNPQGLAGIDGVLQSNNFNLSWPQAAYNADGTPVTDLSGYRVYRSSSYDSAPTLLSFLPADAPRTCTDPQGSLSVSQWYFVRAVDSSGNESIDSPWVRSSIQREFSWVSPDRRARIQIPTQYADTLRSEDVVILWKRHPEEENGRVAASYEISAVDAKTAKSAGPQFLFPSLRSSITFQYTPRNPAGGPLAPSTVFRPEDLAVFFQSGASYVKLGGEVDTVGRTITVESRSVGRYIVKQSLRMTEFTVLQTVPSKIFTPNGDGVNDRFEVFFENPNDSVVSLSKVYDITGAEASDMKLGTSGNSLSWDGKDKSGRVARGGIYIYQIQVEGRTWNGTVVVAR